MNCLYWPRRLINIDYYGEDRRPSRSEPRQENRAKSVVGIMPTTLGIFWTGEGVGLRWPAEDLAVFAIASILLMMALASVTTVRCARDGSSQGSRSC